MIKKLEAILNSSILNLLIGLISLIGLVLSHEEKDLIIFGVFFIFSVIKETRLKNE